jgi:hypothetical protein
MPTTYEPPGQSPRQPPAFATLHCPASFHGSLAMPASYSCLGALTLHHCLPGPEPSLSLGLPSSSRRPVDSVHLFIHLSNSSFLSPETSTEAKMSQFYPWCWELQGKRSLVLSLGEKMLVPRESSCDGGRGGSGVLSLAALGKLPRS